MSNNSVSTADDCQVDHNSVVVSEQVPEVSVEGEAVSSSAVSRGRHTNTTSSSSTAGMESTVPAAAQPSVPDSVAPEEAGPLLLSTTDSAVELSSSSEALNTHSMITRSCCCLKISGEEQEK
ncbi:hypothetical protein V6N12_068424 [Hibiscus sabdariffa]|uniref:Uncharacterized protein n=1 Tax=Hibiscus sabdariffa TaxID=183260 RepID=A0ABR2FPX2_9ROSI